MCMSVSVLGVSGNDGSFGYVRSLRSFGSDIAYAACGVRIDSVTHLHLYIAGGRNQTQAKEVLLRANTTQ